MRRAIVRVSQASRAPCRAGLVTILCVKADQRSPSRRQKSGCFAMLPPSANQAWLTLRSSRRHYNYGVPLAVSGGGRGAHPGEGRRGGERRGEGGVRKRRRGRDR